MLLGYGVKCLHHGAAQPAKAVTAAATQGKWSLKWRGLGRTAFSGCFVWCSGFVSFYEEICSFENLHLPGVSPSHHFSGVTIFTLGMMVAVLILLLIPPNFLGVLGSVTFLPSTFSLLLLHKLQYSLPWIRKIGLGRIGQGSQLVTYRAMKRKCGRS